MCFHRNDPKYIASLGRTVYNFSCIVPHGLLIFFPSYPIMRKCRDEWQNMGLWTQIAERKVRNIYIRYEIIYFMMYISN